MSELLSEEEKVLITDIAMFLAHESQEHGGYGWDSLSHETQTVYMMQGKRLYLEVLPKLRRPREGLRDKVHTIFYKLGNWEISNVERAYPVLEKIEKEILALFDEQEIRKEERERADRLEQALKDDAADLWKVTNAIRKEIESRHWITEGRGPYEWNDDKYREETRNAFNAILKLIDNVQHPAQKRFWQSLSQEGE